MSIKKYTKKLSKMCLWYCLLMKLTANSVSSTTGHILSNYYSVQDIPADHCKKMKLFHDIQYVVHHSEKSTKFIYLCLFCNLISKKNTLKSSISPNNLAVRLYWSLVLYCIRTGSFFVITLPRLSSSNVTTA